MITDSCRYNYHLLLLEIMAFMRVRRLVGVHFSTDQVLSLLGHEDGTINPPQAAALLGVSPSTVIRRITSGEIKGYRLGPHSYRIPASAIPEYLAKSAVVTK
jgi:excisionase family DNA binding protein